MAAIDQALHGLSAVLGSRVPPQAESHAWRGVVAHRLHALQALLDHERTDADAPLAARGDHLSAERSRLAARVSTLARYLNDETAPLSPERVHKDVHRLVADVRHHRQRVSDLAYDSVSLDLGGSE